MFRGFLHRNLKKVAQDEFSSGGCCVFKIHVQIDVPSLEVYSYISRGKFSDEEEILVMGGGMFYNSKEMDTVGFNDLGNGFFETWYTFVHPKKVLDNIDNIDISIERILNQIPTDEYEFINSPDDIIIDAPIDIKTIVFNEILKRKS